jgi:hypothetical protein
VGFEYGFDVGGIGRRAQRRPKSLALARRLTELLGEIHKWVALPELRRDERCLTGLTRCVAAQGILEQQASRALDAVE